jgi:hypothetical protein
LRHRAAVIFGYLLWMLSRHVAEAAPQYGGPMNPVPPNTVMQPVITCPLAIGLEQDAALPIAEKPRLTVQIKGSPHIDQHVFERLHLF